MSVSIDDYDDLTAFVRRLMGRTGRPGETATDYFREVEVRCGGVLGGRRWSVYGRGLSQRLSFATDIGPDEEDYVTDRLIKSNILPIKQFNCGEFDD